MVSSAVESMAAAVARPVVVAADWMAGEDSHPKRPPQG
jgi:hypothetical protein